MAFLVDKYKKMVYAIAWSHLGDSDLSEDVAQETFIKAYSYLGTLRNPDAFSGWLARIARNVCGSFHRTAKRDRAFTQRLGILESAEAVSHEDERESLEEQLWKSFAELPVVHREALTLFYVEGKSVREAATVLGTTEQALRARLFRARIALREHLERRLEDTLDDLQPSKDFTQSVFALLPLSPQGVAGTGGMLAGFGKLLASLSFVVWMTVIQAAMFSWLMMWFSRKEAECIKDTPDNAFRKVLIRRQAITVCAGAVAVMSVTGVCAYRYGPEVIFKVIAVFGVWGTWRVSRLLRVNTTAVARSQVFTMVMITLASAIIGFLHAPFYTFYAALLAVNISSYSSRKQLPRRQDYNMFLRCAVGGLGKVTGESEVGSRITLIQMRAFARFLGQQWLLIDYSERNGRFELVVPPVRMSLAMSFGIRRATSRISISPDGQCSGSICRQDMAVIRQLTGIDVSEEQLEVSTCRVVEYALRRFIEGNTDDARMALTADADDVVFQQSFDLSKHHRRLLLFGMGSIVVVLLLMVLIDILITKH